MKWNHFVKCLHSINEFCLHCSEDFFFGGFLFIIRWSIYSTARIILNQTRFIIYRIGTQVPLKTFGRTLNIFISISLHIWFISVPELRISLTPGKVSLIGRQILKKHLFTEAGSLKPIFCHKNLKLVVVFVVFILLILHLCPKNAITSTTSSTTITTTTAIIYF